MKKIGLIAGNGIFPLEVAKEARSKGYEVAVCAIRGETSEEIGSLADKINWIKLGELSKLVNFFKKAGVEDIVMAGKITKTSIFKGQMIPDFEMLKLFKRLRDRKDDTLLGSVSDYLEEKGLRLLSSLTFLKESLPARGVLGKRKPTKRDLEDVEFGWSIAKEMGRLDIGQTVVVKDKAVMAIEAIEGTDEAILRGGSLGSGDVVVVKVAKPNQDMRFDVPTIGLNTVSALIEAKARCLAIETGKTIILEKEKVIEKLDQSKIVFVSK